MDSTVSSSLRPRSVGCRMTQPGERLREISNLSLITTEQLVIHNYRAKRCYMAEFTFSTASASVLAVGRMSADRTGGDNVINCDGDIFCTIPRKFYSTLACRFFRIHSFGGRLAFVPSQKVAAMTSWDHQRGGERAKLARSHFSAVVR